MSSQDYQARGPINRTALITVRVAPEQRELLHALACERGETLSRMLLSPWQAASGKKPPKRAKKDAASAVAAQPVARIEQAPEALEPQQNREATSTAGRRAAREIPGQASLFAGAEGAR